MTSVAQVLKSKSEQIVYTIAASDSVYNAIRLMAEKQIGALVVTDDNAIVGIVTERDYARKIILNNRSSSDTPVRDVMTASVITVSPADSVDTCMRLCTDSRVRHLPVVDGGKLVGVVSIGDLVKAVISEQGAQIEQLQRYIAG